MSGLPERGERQPEAQEKPMSEKKPYSLSEDEKATPAMVYTPQAMAWGDILTKAVVRVSTYLRTLAPDYVSLHDARVLPMRAGEALRPLRFAELHIRTPQVIAFHLLPPADEPPDYDPSEANRKMERITVFVGPFRFDGLARMAATVDLAKYLEITTETFLSLYEVEVTVPGAPGLGVVRAPQALIRRDAASFALRP
jgi:hypothetical protein